MDEMEYVEWYCSHLLEKDVIEDEEYVFNDLYLINDEVAEDNAKKLGIFIVPVGELESFIRTIGNNHHGPEWLDKVLEQYPDYNDMIYSDVIQFVKSWEI